MTQQTLTQNVVTGEREPGRVITFTEGESRLADDFLHGCLLCNVRTEVVETRGGAYDPDYMMTVYAAGLEPPISELVEYGKAA